MSESSDASFEKQRDQLVQEIAAAMDKVVYNLDILNRSLNDTIQVGKEFENVSRLWGTFYSGLEADKAAAHKTERLKLPEESSAEPTASLEAVVSNL